MPEINTTIDTGAQQPIPTSSSSKGGRTTQTDPVSGASVESNRPIEDRHHHRDAPTIFRQSFIDSQSREKMSALGEEYLEVFQKQAAAEDLKVVAMPMNGAYVVHNGRYGMALIFDEATRRNIGGEFTPRAKIINKIFGDRLVKETIAGLNCEVMTAVLITENDYGTKDHLLAYNAVNRIRNYLKLAMDVPFTMDELQNYSFRIVTNPSTVDHNLTLNSFHGVVPYHMYGFTLDICMDPRARERSRDELREEELDWAPLFTVGAMTEVLDFPDEDERPNAPLVTITAMESPYLSVKLLPLILAVSHEVFIRQGLWLEPFKNFGDKGRNLGNLYPDETGHPHRYKDQKEMRIFLKEFFSQPNLAVDVQMGHFTYPGFELLADGSNDILTKELEYLVNGDDIVLSHPVHDQVSFYTGTVKDGEAVVDSRTIDFWRIVNNHVDEYLCARFKNYYQNPEDRVRAIADAGFNNYSNSSNVLNVLYPTTKYILSAQAINQMSGIASVLNILRNTTRDDQSILSSDKLRQSGLDLATNNPGLFNARGTQAPRYRGYYGSIFGR